MKKSFAIDAIKKHGMLLVYPIDNKKEPKSLWSVAYPRSTMRWEWDQGGDDRVANLWHLREELSRSKKVVYTKWFRGRATFFSRPVFQALLALSLKEENLLDSLSSPARDLLQALEEESPLSTKQLKRITGLVGRDVESTYQRALKELWNRFLIVGFGEVEEGAFPSLAIGSTRLLFEDIYEEARGMNAGEIHKTLDPFWEAQPLAHKQFRRTHRNFAIAVKRPKLYLVPNTHELDPDWQAQ